MKRFYFINDENKEQINLLSLLLHCFEYEITEEQAERAAEELQKHLKIEGYE